MQDPHNVIFWKNWTNQDDKETEAWVSSSDSYTLKKMREYLGMPPLSHKEVECRKCSVKFYSQFVGSKRIEFFCGKCRYQNEREGDTQGLPLGRL